MCHYSGNRQLSYHGSHPQVLQKQKYKPSFQGVKSFLKFGEKEQPGLRMGEQHELILKVLLIKYFKYFIFKTSNNIVYAISQCLQWKTNRGQQVHTLPSG